MNKTDQKTGVWLIGAYGDISTTLIVGLCAIRSGLSSNTALVSELTPFQKLGLTPFERIVLGGHDIVSTSVAEQADTVSERSRTFSYPLLQQITGQLAEIDREIVVAPDLAWDTGRTDNSRPTLSDLSDKFRGLLRNFAQRNELDHVVVVNVASAEAYIPLTAAHENLAKFIELISNDRKDLISPSMLCAHGAFLENCSYVNFTPSIGASIGALQQLAIKNGLPHCGSDGKTGETLIKTALAPMFAARNLRIMSWEGTNMLGNGDGRTLNIPEHCQNKLKNKEGVLPQILGYSPHSRVDINYVPSLGDWKTAWDLIHFSGFLDVPMTMQFTWQGCDSILAAPLVIDMIRFAEFAHRHGEGGTMSHLACFFKNPLGVSEHNFHKQFEGLLRYADEHLNMAS